MKTCLFNGCELPVFSHGYCKRHQCMKTDDKKPKQTSFKPYKPRSFKKGTNTKAKENNGFKSQLQRSFGFDNQKQMFEFIWDSRPHVCALSGQDLNKVSNERIHWCMAHILNKKNYPFFKLKEDNILLVHPDVHTMVDNFTEDLREKHKHINFNLWFQLVEQKKQEYKEFLKLNML